jgi:hypothetical protein
MTYPGEYYCLGNWNTQGVPTYITSIDNVQPNLLSRIINTLPEGSNLNNSHPSFITNDGPRNLIIKSTDSSFSGADVYMTFFYEGAGYLNTVGYYVYPLNPNTDADSSGNTLYNVPTKWNGTKWIPMTYSDRNSVDGNGKSILKKTIVFPNASLPTWANSNGTNHMAGGGNLLPGSKVKLLFDPSNPSTVFPNNTGIGFFLIPNGFSGGNVRNNSERVHTDNVFNASSYVQTILLNDLENTTSNLGSMVISFEDIMRPGGDSDFNDIIIGVSWTPLLSFDPSDTITLPGSDPITSDGIIIDRTGIYHCLQNYTVNTYFNRSCSTYTFNHTIYEEDGYDDWILTQGVGNKPKPKFDSLCDLFNTFDYENNCVVSNGTSGGKKYINLSITVNRTDLQNYMYILNVFKNREKTSPSHTDEETSALVDLQTMYVKCQDKLSQTLGIHDSNNVTVKNTSTCHPVSRDLTTPYAMGDPHIVTFAGDRFELPNDDSIYELYNDNELVINVKLSQYPPNLSDNLFKDLRFIEYLGIRACDNYHDDSMEKKNHHIIANMFHIDCYYDDDMTKIYMHDNFNMLKESDINQISAPRRKYYAQILDTDQFDLRYVQFKTKKLGNVFVELMHIPHRNDTVNGISIIADNLMFTSSEASGIFVNRKDVIKKTNII